MVKKAALYLAACWIATLGVARADSITVGFPSSSSTTSGIAGFLDGFTIGYFWSASRGDGVSQTYDNTFLDSVDRLDLNLLVNINALQSGATVDWDVFLNGALVGSWSWGEGDGTGPAQFSFNFAPIVGSGSYTIEMLVTNDVPIGGGSIALAYPTTATLFPSTPVVPEPTSIVLAGLGVLGAFVGRRRLSPA